MLRDTLSKRSSYRIAMHARALKIFPSFFKFSCRTIWSEMISALSLEGRYDNYFVTSERKERGTKYDNVARAIQLILPSLKCDKLFISHQSDYIFKLLFIHIIHANCKIIVKNNTLNR